MTFNDYHITIATKKDSRHIWKIRNQPTIRKNSINQTEIPLLNHNEWFLNKYFTKNKNICFILKKTNKIIGYCRFDFNNEDNNYTISIAIDQNHQSKGAGSALLKQSLEKLPYKENIVAEIKKINIPSIKLFQKYNFKIYKENNLNYYLKYERV